LGSKEAGVGRDLLAAYGGNHLGGKCDSVRKEGGKTIRQREERASVRFLKEVPVNIWPILLPAEGSLSCLERRTHGKKIKKKKRQKGKGRLPLSG